MTKVPYSIQPGGTEWNLCFGLFHSNRDDEGFMVPDFSRVQVKSSLSRGLPRIGKWLVLVELEERGIGLRLGGLSGSIAISLQGRCQGDGTVAMCVGID